MGKKCKTCSSAGCSSCFKGYYTSGADCVACQDNCLTCSSSACTKCAVGYYPSGSTCQTCTDSSCESCVDGAGTCGKCRPGFALYDNTCFECIQGCNKCSVLQLGSCIGCAKGFYISSSGKCLPCKLGCSECSSASVCSACSPGYKLNAGGNICVKQCEFPCRTCSASVATSCLSCYGGYTYSSQRQACIRDLSCNQDQSCTRCPRSYYLNGGECLACSITNCISCELVGSSPQCTSCQSGYALSDSFTC